MIHFLEEIPENIKVFIDANIFVYFFSKESVFNSSCTKFFKKIEKKELWGITNAIIIQEAIHRIMIEEALITFPEIGLKKITHFLKNNPEIIKQLRINRYLVYVIENLGINVIPVTFETIKKAQNIKKQYGLLNNDALLVQTMFENQIVNLATNDKDFERITEIHIYKPTPS